MDKGKQRTENAENDYEKNARYLASCAPTLLKQAVNRLQQRLQKNPEDSKLWFQLGNIYRGLGELRAASNAFDHAFKLNYEPSLSRYLNALCNQSSIKLTYPDSAFTPTPFVRYFDLLTDKELKVVWEIFSEQTKSFKLSGVSQNQVRKTTRSSIVLGGSKLKILHELFKMRIKPILEQAFESFGIELPSQQRYVIQMTSHADGEFYRTHTDVGPQHARVLSYVYYFNRQPKAFSGGELQLFDTNTAINTATTTMTSIEPLHNSLIVFPSNYYHQVCTVNLPDKERLWGRQTINGWLVDEERQAEIYRLQRETGSQ